MQIAVKVLDAEQYAVKRMLTIHTLNGLRYIRQI